MNLAEVVHNTIHNVQYTTSLEPIAYTYTYRGCVFLYQRLANVLLLSRHIPLHAQLGTTYLFYSMEFSFKSVSYVFPIVF